MKNITTKKMLLACTMYLTINNTYALDIEIDPIAYGLSGYSLHAGFGRENFRLDIGIFGLKAPTSFHGNDNYELDYKGYGAKIDYLFGSYDGLFVGLEASSTNIEHTLKSTGETADRTQIAFGPRIGYRFFLNKNITITPWIGMGFNLETDDVTLSGETFDQDPITLFPTVHVGWKF